MGPIRAVVACRSTVLGAVSVGSLMLYISLGAAEAGSAFWKRPPGRIVRWPEAFCVGARSYTSRRLAELVGSGRRGSDGAARVTFGPHLKIPRYQLSDTLMAVPRANWPPRACERCIFCDATAGPSTAIRRREFRSRTNSRPFRVLAAETGPRRPNAAPTWSRNGSFCDLIFRSKSGGVCLSALAPWALCPTRAVMMLFPSISWPERTRRCFQQDTLAPVGLTTDKNFVTIRPVSRKQW